VENGSRLLLLIGLFAQHFNAKAALHGLKNHVLSRSPVTAALIRADHGLHRKRGHPLDAGLQICGIK